MNGSHIGDGMRDDARSGKNFNFPPMEGTAQNANSLSITAENSSGSWIDDGSVLPRRSPVSAALLIAWGAAQTRAGMLGIIIFFLGWAALVLAMSGSGLAWVGTAGVVSGMLAMGYSLYAHARNIQTDDVVSVGRRPLPL